MNDEINNPPHYQLFPGQQAIDVIQAALTPEEFAGYCKGNALKYRLRAGDKGPAEKCIAKANWYQEKLRSVHATDRTPGTGAADQVSATEGQERSFIDILDPERRAFGGNSATAREEDGGTESGRPINRGS